MKRTALAIALLMSGAAVAQTTTTTQPDVDVDADVGVQPDGDLDVDADVDVDTETTTTTTDATTTHSTTTHATTAPQDMSVATTMAPASGQVIQPSNADPERDMRGIAVISEVALVPTGWNGVATSPAGMGGPLVDPATGQTTETAGGSYPACTAQITDNCVQTYERGRS